jgi:hypothetical protein
LRLVAIGRNNREVAQVLCISPNTVANHLRSILEKTYRANRTEAAAFASRQGLLRDAGNTATHGMVDVAIRRRGTHPVAGRAAVDLRDADPEHLWLRALGPLGP